MDDDTTGSFLRTSRHVSVWIEAAPEVVYEFAPPNEFGVLDHAAAAVAADLNMLRQLQED